MDSSGVGAMGEMGMGMFADVNMALARGFWYGAAAVVGLFAITNLLDLAQNGRCQSLRKANPRCIPSRPRGWLSQVYASASAVTRELLYPQPIYFTGRLSKYFSPLPLGRWLLLVIYWIVVLLLLWSDTTLESSDIMYPYRWEKVGFRAAWVSITQMPLIYLLSCKFNPISLLTGISYERFNWLHRWTARTVFMTSIVHWSFFFREWTLGDIVDFELQMMPMVKYGFGAWGVIAWMVLSGFGFFRALSYEVFVLQHLTAAAALLWCLHMHVPLYARYNIWMAVGFVTVDWSARIIIGLRCNIDFAGGVRVRTLGYSARLEHLPGNVIRVTIENVNFSWKAGQHVYICVPRIRPFEMHPFTIASAPAAHQNASSRRLSIVLQARSGMSKSLLKAAHTAREGEARFKVLVSGPWGAPPDLGRFETVGFIACSTGASFVMPLLRDLLAKENCVEKCRLHWVIRRQEHLLWFKDEVDALNMEAQQGNVELHVHIHVTQSTELGSSWQAQQPMLAPLQDMAIPSAPTLQAERESDATSASDEQTPLASSETHSKGPTPTIHLGGRPTLDGMIRPAVEEACGETAIIVCGGTAITAQSRTFVAALSDERAVHKGTGAQGIFLHTETYGW